MLTQPTSSACPGTRNRLTRTLRRASVGGFAGRGQRRGENRPGLLWRTCLREVPGLRGPGRVSRSKAAWTSSDVLHITGLKPEAQAVTVRDGTAAVRLAAFRPTRTGGQRVPAPPAGAAPPGPPAVTPAVRSLLHLLLLGPLVLTMSYPCLHYKQLLDLFTALILTMFMVFTSRIF